MVYAEGFAMPKGCVRVAYDRDFSPFTFQDGERPGGLAVDIVGAVLAHVGRAVEFIPIAHASQDAALAAGDVDALAFKGVTASRLDQFDFSAAMFVSGGSWFYPAAGPAPKNRPSKGVRVATPTKGPLGAEIKELFADLIVVKVETYADSLRAVLEDKADLAALGLQIGTALARRDFAERFHLPRAPFKPIPMALAVAKGKSAPLLDEFDKSLAALKRQGTIATIESRWLGA